MSNKYNRLNLAEKLISIGISLSSERDTDRLLETILKGAKDITDADGGTLYLLNEADRCLEFAIMQTDSLGIHKGGSTGEPIELKPIPLLAPQGYQNVHNIAAFAANTGQSVNIQNAYKAEGFDFSGVKAYDATTGYRSVSFLAIPMTNHEKEIIGVLQLINARDDSGNISAFSPEDQRLTEALAAQAAIVLTNNNLTIALRELLEKFIELIAAAIDEKSPYTGGHCRRVPDIAMMLADAVHETNRGPHAMTQFTPQQFYELKIAALLHDCGKITTPVHVVDKATKLETIYDRINTINTRFEVVKRDMEIDMLRATMQAGGNKELVRKLEQEYRQNILKLTEDQAFLQQANLGTEFMKEESQKRVREITQYTWVDNGVTKSLLNDDEVKNLCIQKGTLTQEEREVINNHIVLSQRMLHSLPFPRQLRNVPEIAGNHHERMDGKGYPNGLTKEEMSVQARIMGIADIFEALTATDRPYKKPMPLSQALKILGNMAEEQHIDGELFQIFIDQRVYMQYAEKVLSPEQIDEVHLSDIPGLQQSGDNQQQA